MICPCLYVFRVFAPPEENKRTYFWDIACLKRSAALCGGTCACAILAIAFLRSSSFFLWRSPRCGQHSRADQPLLPRCQSKCAVYCWQCSRSRACVGFGDRGKSVGSVWLDLGGEAYGDVGVTSRMSVDSRGECWECLNIMQNVGCC